MAKPELTLTSTDANQPSLFDGLQKKKTESVYYVGDYDKEEDIKEKIEQAFQAMNDGKTKGFSIKIVNNRFRIRASIPKEKG